jgi:hypothetical protein
MIGNDLPIVGAASLTQKARSKAKFTKSKETCHPFVASELQEFAPRSTAE